MESSLHSATTLVTISKTLASPFFSRLIFSSTRPLTRSRLVRFNSPRRSLYSPRSRFSFAASYSASGIGGRGGAGGDGGGGGSGGGRGGGERKGGEAVVAGGGAEEGSPDVIILDVGGMTCGGCAASVKRILESQPHVSSASVNLATEIAIVWPVAEAKVTPYWQKQLGEALAKHLTTCGFKSNIRGQGAMEEVLS